MHGGWGIVVHVRKPVDVVVIIRRWGLSELAEASLSHPVSYAIQSQGRVQACLNRFGVQFPASLRRARRAVVWCGAAAMGAQGDQKLTRSQYAKEPISVHSKMVTYVSMTALITLCPAFVMFL